MSAYSSAIHNYENNKSNIENNINVYNKENYNEIVGQLDLDILKELLPENLKLCMSND